MPFPLGQPGCDTWRIFPCHTLMLLGERLLPSLKQEGSFV